MSDAAPDWSDIPPPEFDGRGGPAGGGGRGGGKRNGPPPMTEAQLAEASADFFDWLATPATAEQLKILLPEQISVPVFVATAKTAVLTNPQLLREDFRASLLTSLMKAAKQGLLPDGKQGVLVPRYDTNLRRYAIAWQPMIWGIVHLGRETGAIRSIRAMLVFHGETFRVVQGDEDRIEHEVDLDIVDAAYEVLNAGRDANGNALSNPAAFMARVRAAYCVVTGMDGTVTKRWMSRHRLISLWESTNAAKGPWSGRWIDEMLLKGMILFTAKWINLDPNSVAAKRFQAAMLTDLEIDFNRDGDIIAAAEAEPAALPAPGDKLGGFEDMMTNPKQKVAAHTQPPSARHPGMQAKAAPAKEAAPKAAKAAAKAAPVQDKPVPFIDRATEALKVDGGIGFKWMRTLDFACRDCPTIDDLAALKADPSVVRNLKTAPAQVRSEIDGFFRTAAQRLGVASEANDGWPNRENAA
jgi:recombinational DNA repair protein RecT